MWSAGWLWHYIEALVDFTPAQQRARSLVAPLSARDLTAYRARFIGANYTARTSDEYLARRYDDHDAEIV